MDNAVVNRIRHGLTSPPKFAERRVDFYVANDDHTKASFEIAVLRCKLRYKTAVMSDREGFKKYEVIYSDPADLITLGYTFGSEFRS